MAARTTRTATKSKSTKSASTKRSTAGSASSAGKVGRGTRWSDEQVKLLQDTVKASATAKEAFEVVARQLGKSAGTVQQKYYNLQKAAGGGARRRPGRPAGTKRTSAARATGTAPRSSRTGNAQIDAIDLRALSVDDLVGLASRVKGEVDRRRKELDAAARQLAG